VGGNLPVRKMVQRELFSKFFCCGGGLDRHHSPDKE
jgi:hypothetical protein